MNIRNVVVGVIIILAAAILPTVRVDAQSLNADALRVSPVRTDIVIDPGESKSVKFTIFNPSKTDISIHPLLNDFVAGDERGMPALNLDETDQVSKYSLRNFTKPIDEIIVPSKESVDLELEINIPNDARAGGYFGALRFAPSTPANGSQVNLSASMASIILVRVSGEVSERLMLTDFTTQRRGVASSFFGNGDDIDLALRFYNDSAVQLGPIGRISLTRGEDIVYEANFNNRNRQDMILPDSARRWEVPLNEIDNFGRYTVTALFTYGSKNQSIEVTKVFWVIPMWVIIVAVVILMLVLAIAVYFVYRIRKNRRHSRRLRAKTGLRAR